MNETQSFRLIGGTEIVKLPVQDVDGQSIVHWENIELAFPRVRYVKNGDVQMPCFIKHVPDVVLDVALSSTIDPVYDDSPVGAPSMVQAVALNSAPTVGGTDARANRPNDPSTTYKSVEDLRVTHALKYTPIDNNGKLISSIVSSVLSENLPSQSMTSSKTTLSFMQVAKLISKKAHEPDGQIQQQDLTTQMARVIKLHEASDDKQDKIIQMAQMTLDHHEEIKQLQMASAAKQDEMTQLQKESDAKQEQMLLLQKELSENQGQMILLQKESDAKQEKMDQLTLGHQEKMEQMQQRILDQLSELHARVQVILTQTFELHEYPIPRLFVVLPEDPSAWNAVDPFSNKFRLYFLCECGEHTKVLNSQTKIPHHIHLAKHEGYVVARPSEFFEQYGDYVLTILKMLKFGVTVAGVIMPSFSQLVSPDGLGQTLASLELLKNSIVPGADHVINSIDKAAGDDGNVIEGVAAQVDIKETLEGVELRRLGTFLEDSDGSKVLGNLYRTVTNEGHVKWVCIDHYRENYQARMATEFQAIVKSVDGTFDENLGRVEVILPSRAQAELFYAALEKAKSVHELKIQLFWDTTYGDFKTLRDSLRRTNVGVLEFAYLGTGPPSDLMNRNRRYDPIVQIMGNPSIQSFTIHSEQGNFLRRSNLVAVNMDFSNLKRLVVSGCNSDAFIDRFYRAPALTTLCLSRSSIGDSGAQVLSKVLKTKSTLTTLGLGNNSIGVSGAQALAEVLKNNSTLTTLNLGYNSIGDSGAMALSEVLKLNTTMITLDLQDNAIGNSGALEIVEALKTNKALSTLDLSWNMIGYEGMLALLPVRMTMNLDLSYNSSTEKGVQALSKGLTTISTMTALSLQKSSIGNSEAEVLAEALKTNEFLTTLDLQNNLIYDNGAQALAEALKINKTLTTLNLQNNSIGDNGAQALAEALKTNNALTTLNLQNNSIRGSGAQALAEALKTNKTLTTLDLKSNMIGDSGAQALAEALKTNKNLSTLNLESNSIRDNGAKALVEALETNRTLSTLNLRSNSITGNGAQALTEALNANKKKKRESAKGGQNELS